MRRLLVWLGLIRRNQWWFVDWGDSRGMLCCNRMISRQDEQRVRMLSQQGYTGAQIANQMNGS